jgi:haloacetate dehalogenase
MSQWSQTRVQGSGVVLNVRQAGAGAAVLLLHGFPDSSRLWVDVAPRLVAAGYKVIAPDLRGFGRS